VAPHDRLDDLIFPPAFRVGEWLAVASILVDYLADRQVATGSGPLSLWERAKVKVLPCRGS
jgi:hypothetical protein